MGAVLMNDTIVEDSNVMDMELKYIDYIEDHRKNVALAFTEVFGRKFMQNKDWCLPNYTSEQTLAIMNILKYELEKHDRSKFSNEEFPAYREKFYPTEIEKNNTSEEYQERVKENYELAWKHHYTFNDHHPAFYCINNILETSSFGLPVKWVVNKEEVIPAKVNMSIISICHMICDWYAMSLHFGTDMCQWYINKASQERSYMSKDTKHIVWVILNDLYPEKMVKEDIIDSMDKQKG